MFKMFRKKNAKQSQSSITEKENLLSKGNKPGIFKSSKTDKPSSAAIKHDKFLAQQIKDSGLNL